MSRRDDNGKFRGRACGRTAAPNSRWFLTNVVFDGTVRWSLARSYTLYHGVQGGAPKSVWAEPQNRKTPARLHFAALRLLLIIYAASAASLPTPSSWPCTCVAPRIETGAPAAARGVESIGIIARVSRTGDRANRANPIESRNRFARNNNHDWIPRGFGGRTFRSP